MIEQTTKEKKEAFLKMPKEFLVDMLIELSEKLDNIETADKKIHLN